MEQHEQQQQQQIIQQVEVQEQIQLQQQHKQVQYIQDTIITEQQQQLEKKTNKQNKLKITKQDTRGVVVVPDDAKEEEETAQVLEIVEGIASPIFEKLTPHLTSQESAETTAFSESPLMATADKPKTVKARESLMSQQNIVVQELHQTMEIEQEIQKFKHSQEVVSESVEEVELRAPSVVEQMPAEEPSQLSPFKMTKTKVKRSKDLSKRKSLVVESPLVEESLEEHVPSKETERHADANIVPVQAAPEQHQIVVTESIQKLVTDKLAQPEDSRTTMVISSKRGLVVEEIISAETTEKEVSLEKTPALEIPQRLVSTETSVEVAQVEVHDTIKELHIRPEQPQEKSQTSFVEHKSYESQQPFAVEVEEEYVDQTGKPNKLTANEVVKDVSTSLEIRDTEPMESLQDMSSKKSDLSQKATDKLVFVEGFQTTQADLQSPLDELRATFPAGQGKQAEMRLQELTHLVEKEVFIEEAKPQDLHVPHALVARADLQGELPHLVSHEVTTTLISEKSQELIVPEVDMRAAPKQTLGGALTPVGETQHEQILDTVVEHGFELPALQKGKANVEGTTVVADVLQVLTQEKETTLETTEPKLLSPLEANVMENVSALTISSQQTVEKEETLKPFETPKLQKAGEHSTLHDLKAPNVELVQTEMTTKPLEFQPSEPIQAQRHVDATHASLTYATTMLESDTAMPAIDKAKEIKIQPSIAENSVNLEIYEINISESLAGQPGLEQPLAHRASVQQNEQKLKYVETLESMILETSEASHMNVEYEKPTATQYLAPQHAVQEMVQTIMDLPGHMPDIKGPEMQQPQRNIEVTHALDTMEIPVHDKESILHIPEQPSIREATLGATKLLQIAETFTAQTVENSQRLVPHESNEQTASATVDSEIIPALSSEMQDLESVAAYDSSAPLKSMAISNISLQEYHGALDVAEVNVSDKEVLKADMKIPHETMAETRLTSELFKSVQAKKELIFEVPEKFDGIPSLETQGQHIGIEKLQEISINSVNFYEREEDLSVKEMQAPQEAQVVLKPQSQLALSLKEEVLETSDDYKPQGISHDSAQLIVQEGHLKLPLKAVILQQDSTSALEPFKTTVVHAKLSSDILRETTTEQTLVLESTTSKEHGEKQKEEHLTTTLHESPRHAFEESSDQIMELEAKLNLATWTKEKVAQSSITDTFNLPLSSKPKILESIADINEVEEEKRTAKQTSDERSLLLGMVDRPEVLESVGDIADETIPQTSEAKVQHVFDQAIVVDACEAAESEGVLETEKPALLSTSKASSVQQLILPLVEEIKTQEATQDAAVVALSTITATSNIEGSQKEIVVTETLCLEKSEKLTEPKQNIVQAANTSVEEHFKITQTETLQDTLLKEMRIIEALPNEEKPKTFIEGMFRETISTKPMAFEEATHLETPQVSTNLAKPLTQDAVNQSLMQQLDTAMHKETELQPFTEEKLQAKPKLQPTNEELVIEEIKTLEEVEKFDTSPAPDHKAQTAFTDTPTKIQTINSTIVLEKESQMPCEMPRTELVLGATRSPEQLEKTVSEVVTYEEAVPIKDIPKVDEQIALISTNETTQQIPQISTEHIFNKESHMEPFHMGQEKADVVQDKLKALIAEENIGISTITESYDFKNQTGVYPKVVEDTSKLQAQTVEAIIAYEDTPKLASLPQIFEQAVKIDSENKNLLQTSTVQIYESLADESGDFKPKTGRTTSSIALPELKASITEQIITDTGIGSVPQEAPQKNHTQPIETPLSSENLTTQTVTAFESTLKMSETEDTKPHQAHIALAETTHQLATKLDLTTSQDVAQMALETPQLQQPLEKIHTQSMYLNETETIPTENTHALEPPQTPMAQEAKATPITPNQTYSTSTVVAYDQTETITTPELQNTQPNTNRLEAHCATLNTTHVTGDTLTPISEQLKTTTHSARTNIEPTQPMHELFSQQLLEKETQLPESTFPQSKSLIVGSQPEQLLQTAITNTVHTSTATSRDHELPPEKPLANTVLNIVNFSEYLTADTIQSHPLTEITESHDDVDSSSIKTPQTPYTVTELFGKYIVPRKHRA